MTRSAASLLPLLLLLAAMPQPRAAAFVVIPTDYELAETCDVAFRGAVEHIGKQSATIKVTALLHGKLPAASVLVTPLTCPTCGGDAANFAIGEEVLIFAKFPAVDAPDNAPLEILDSGLGKKSLTDEDPTKLIAALNRCFAVARMKTGRDKIDAIFQDVRSDNPYLSRAATDYIRDFDPGNDAASIRRLLEFLVDDRGMLQESAASALGRCEPLAIVPMLIALSRSPDPHRVAAAGLALREFDSPMAVAALRTLAHHPEPLIRRQACMDLACSRSRDADRVLVEMLSEKDSLTRQFVLAALAENIRWNNDTDLVATVARRLDDPVVCVRIAAAHTLGQSNLVEALPPLFAALQQEPGDQLTAAILDGLAENRIIVGHQEALDAQIGLIINAVKSSKGDVTSGLEILKDSDRPEAAAALRWAETSHPVADTRAYARDLLHPSEE